jgi:molecular chaperone HtpG
MPYRSQKQRRRVEPVRDGMVADMVRQFADPYAFLRELVQNGIDAGASRLEVRFELDDGGQATLSVDDDGEGMSREIIEGPLLTLFNSAKDRDDTKIGRYGVGFVSVLAIEPDEVQVQTWRDGTGWLLRLWTDQSFELAEAAPRADSGTTVTLFKTATVDEFGEHVDAGRAALERWCRHAQIPIHVVVRRPGVDATEERVDRELSVAAAVRLRQRLVSDDGVEETFVVAPSSGESGSEGAPVELSESYAGFYNRGLTLFETNEPPHPSLRGIRFKVNSSRLQHTVSRDNVRHDEGYARVVAKVRELVDERLDDEVEKALQEAACALVDNGDAQRYVQLLRAAVGHPLALEADRVTVPLCDAVGAGQRAAVVADLQVSGVIHYAAAPTPISAALAREHVPVMLASDSAVLPLVQQLATVKWIDVADRYVLTREIEKAELSRSDRRLVRETRLALEAGGTTLEHLAFVMCEGESGRRAAICTDDEAREHLVTHEQGGRWRKRLGAGLRLLLVQEHPAVRAARALAERDAALAGQLLGRYLLVEQYGELSARQNDGMLEQGAARRRRSR